MIIDYFNCDAYEKFFKRAAKPPERCTFDARKDYKIYARYVDHVKNPEEGGGPVATRYVSFHEVKTRQIPQTVTENVGPFGLFRRTKEVEITTSYPDMDTKARFSVLGTLFDPEQHYSATGIYEMVDFWDKNKTLLFDVETGLPCLLRQPTNLKEIEMLLRADPRFVAYIDPAIVRAEEVARGYKLDYAIARATQQGLDRILNSQAELGVVFDDAERAERKAFVEEVTCALETFMENYNEMSSGAYELNKQVDTKETVSDELGDDTTPQSEEDNPTSGNN